MKLFASIFLILAVYSMPYAQTECALPSKAGVNYKADKIKIAELRNTLFTRYTQISDTITKIEFLDSVSDIFTQQILHTIIPYWYGTKWDFNGYTETPKKGVIACGYFVSTTLRDMGITVNRYKLAQQLPEIEAKSIAIQNKNTFSLEISKFTNVGNMLSNLQNGLYFVGLENHVGYFLKQGNCNYFIHSDYYTGKVSWEKVEASPAFTSNIYYFTKITHNSDLALHWISQKQVVIK